MITHDFRCPKCGQWTEVIFGSFAEFTKTVECGHCGGEAVHGWRVAPGLAGVSEPSTRGITRTFHPGFDTQAGRYFESRAERDRWLAKKGLVGMGPDEYKTNVAQSKPNDIDLTGIKETMNEAYEEVKANPNIPAGMPELDLNKTPVIDTGRIL